MEMFLESVKLVGKELEEEEKIIKRINELARKVSGASTDEEMKDILESLHTLRDDFLSGMHEVKEGISSIQKKLEEDKDSSHHNTHVKQQHVASLIERSKKVMNNFSTSQSEFGEEERHRLKSQYIIARPTATKEEIEHVEYNMDDKPFIMPGKSRPVAEERKKSLKRIVEGVQEVTKMTDELNLLVVNTEKDVDKVAVTTTKTEAKAKKADVDLKKALKYQRLARFAKMLVYGFVSILVIFLIVTIIGGILISLISFVVGYFPTITIAEDEDRPRNTGEENGNQAGGGGTGGTGGTGGGAPSAMSAGSSSLVSLQSHAKTKASNALVKPKKASNALLKPAQPSKSLVSSPKAPKPLVKPTKLSRLANPKAK
ncbi:hypothetical protein NEFER01_1694 [Nematocida sp. LUAm1]|nr:hypothetical protein NEFER02_1539 [Nematocida sp. LUAm2]KAI5178558.1 hypothetical protein NEFER01_1694 [Nematocida sp. LUAm1]